VRLFVAIVFGYNYHIRGQPGYNCSLVLAGFCAYLSLWAETKIGWPVMGYTPFSGSLPQHKTANHAGYCLLLFPIALQPPNRSSMLEVMKEDYIRTACPKGSEESMTCFSTCAQNGLIPVITLLGINLSMIIGGSVIIETVFNIPGTG